MSLSEDEIRRSIVDDDPGVCGQFLAAFSRRLNPIVHRAAVVHRSLARFERLDPSERVKLVYAYLHAALNNVCSSTALMVAGYPLAAGHLMRQYGECVAMALLLTDEESGVYEEVVARPIHFRVSGILSRLDDRSQSERLRRSLGFDATAWRRFKEITTFYHNFSHASVFSLFYHTEHGEHDRIVIGAHFDPSKKPYFRKELTVRRSALDSLGDLVRTLYRKLPRGPRTSAA